MIDVLAVLLGILCVELYETDTPIWAIFFAVGLCVVLQVPIGIIIAVTNVEVTNNVLAEFIGGYALSGKPLPLMIFKSASLQSYGYRAADHVGHTAILQLLKLFRSLQT